MPQLRQSNGPYEKISEQDEQRLLDAYENNQDFVEFAKILKKREQLLTALSRGNVPPICQEVVTDRTEKLTINAWMLSFGVSKKIS